LPENPTTFFYLSGSPTRLIFQKDASGQVRGLIYRDDRHEEFWTLVPARRSNSAQR